MICEWWTQPEWWTAIFSGVLVLVTIVTVILAARAYHLESEPVLVCTYAPSSPHHRSGVVQMGLGSMRVASDSTMWYVIAHDRKDATKLEIRSPLEGEVSAYHTSGTYLEIKNVGRSPAVGITLCVSISVDASGQVPAANGTGRILIDVIGPLSPYFIGVSNRTGVTANFLPDPWSTQVDWADKRHAADPKPKAKPLRVLSMTFALPPQPDTKSGA